MTDICAALSELPPAVLWLGAAVLFSMLAPVACLAAAWAAVGFMRALAWVFNIIFPGEEQR